MIQRSIRLFAGIVLGALLIYVGLTLASVRMIAFPWWYKAQLKPPGVLPPCTSYQSETYSYCRDPRADLNLEYRDFQIDRRDGEGRMIHTSGWWVFAPAMPLGSDPAPGVVLVHGGGADRRAMMKHAPYLHRAGFHVFLIDCHNHGLNPRDGQGISLGPRETESVLAAVDWAKDQIESANAGADGMKKRPPVFVFGTSQGGFAALRAASKSPFLAGVIAESPYVSAKRLIDEFPGLTWMPRIFKHSALFLLGMWWRHPIAELDVHTFAEGLRNTRVLLIHSKEDQVTSPKNSEEIYGLLKDMPGKELWLAPSGAHEAVVNELGLAYQKRVLEFLTRPI